MSREAAAGAAAVGRGGLRGSAVEATWSRVTKADALPRGVLATGDGFWNLRGSFKLGGIVELGTQSSLVRLASGRYVLLDACGLGDEVVRWVRARTEGGEAIEAILHLHPFHTLHVRAVHQLFPHARLFGTARHHRLAPELPWEPLRTDEPELHARYAADLVLTVPRGVELIPADESLHFSSVLALHRGSRTLHVDDTLNFVGLPRLLHSVARGVMRFHPTLARVLEKRPGAAADFRAWARELAGLARDVDSVCAAHTAALVGRKEGEPSVAERIEHALAKVEPILRAHEAKHG